MDMMKKMYEEGDDEMKRTIAKAWTEGQDKKVMGENWTATLHFVYFREWAECLGWEIFEHGHDSEWGIFQKPISFQN